MSLFPTVPSQDRPTYALLHKTVHKLAVRSRPVKSLSHLLTLHKLRATDPPYSNIKYNHNKSPIVKLLPHVSAPVGHLLAPWTASTTVLCCKHLTGRWSIAAETCRQSITTAGRLWLDVKLVGVNRRDIKLATAWGTFIAKHKILSFHNDWMRHSK
jgi:hypothetical protein